LFKLNENFGESFRAETLHSIQTHKKAPRAWSKIQGDEKCTGWR